MGGIDLIQCFKNFLEKKIQIKFNWALILLFVFFWNHGFYGSAFTSNVSIPFYFMITLIMVFIIYFLFQYGVKSNSEFDDYVSFNLIDLLIFNSYLFLLFIVSYKQLISYPKFDSILNAQAAHLHSYNFLKNITKLTDAFNQLNSKILMIGVDFFILIFFIAAISFLRKLINKHRVITLTIIIVLFIVFRTFIYKAGGFGTGHPPFKLFPIWISSTILGFTNISFKLPGLLALSFCMFVFYKRVSLKINLINSYLIGLFIGTIPLLLHVSTLVEQSIWAAIFSSIFLIDINQNERLNYLKWLSATTIFLLLRQSLIVVFIPFLIFSLKDRSYAYCFLQKNYKSIIIILSTWLIFLLSSLATGTGSTRNLSFSFFYKILEVIESGIIINVFKNDIQLFSLMAFFLFAFIPLKKSTYFSNLINMIFFVSFFLIFAILPNYGDPEAARYQAEYIIPFVIIGFYLFINFIFERLKNKKVMTFILLLIIAININNYNKIYNKSVQEIIASKDFSYKYLYANDIFEYDEVYLFLKSKKDNLKSFFIGTKSEPFNLVLDNMNLENVINYEIFSNELIDPPGLNVNKLKNNDELKYLVVEDFRHLFVSKSFISSNFIEAGPYMKSLLSENWLLESSFSSNNYSNIHIFSK
jgi:hypothetical protein